jgi:outer membrane protein assembly factor BamB
MKSATCVSKICVTNRKQAASFSIVGSMLAIAPLWLMLAAANPPGHAQTPDAVSNSSAATPSPADWTEFHRDNMQRWNPYETVLGVNSVGSLQVKWKNPIGTYTSNFESSPAVVNGVVYFGSDDGNVYALNASTGAKLWSDATTGSPVRSSPAVANGVVYIASGGAMLIPPSVYALNANTGTLRWSYLTAQNVVSSPAVVSGVVYIASGDSTSGSGTVYALTASTGALLWSLSRPTAVESSPAVANGVVYFGDDGGEVSAVNASTGALLWTYATGGVVESSPAVANGVVYVGSSNGNVYALNAGTGAKLWSYATGGSVISSPAVANGMVYVGSYGNNVYALDARTGSAIWTYYTRNVVFSSPAVANGVIYVASYDGNVYALDARTGAKLWSYDIGLFSSSPIVVDGVLYIRAGNSPGPGNIYAFSVGADLFLRVQPSSTTVQQGDLLTYAFPVWNLGPGNADHEVLNTQVPAGTTFDYVRISGTPGLGTCTTPAYGGTGQIICHENASMAPNTTWTVRLTVKVTAAAGATITENAATMADTPDPNTTNNMATVSVKVQ